MSQHFLVGFLFVVAGLALFLAQVVTMEVCRGYKAVQSAINGLYGHDAHIFPDHQYTEGQSSPRRRLMPLETAVWPENHGQFIKPTSPEDSRLRGSVPIS